MAAASGDHAWQIGDTRVVTFVRRQLAAKSAGHRFTTVAQTGCLAAESVERAWNEKLLATHGTMPRG